MDFAAAFRFPFRGPHRWANIGFLVLCFLIPIVGPIVIGGYIVFLEKALIADPLADPPKFDFGRFTDYLRRGLYPFLVGLVLAPVFMLLFIPLAIGMVFSLALLDRQPVLGFILLAAVIIIQVVATVGLVVALQPMAFKAGLENSFKGAFDWRFIVSWWKKVGLQTLLSVLVVMTTSFVATLVLLCTFVGIYAAMAVLMVVQGHLQFQLYRLYLARGGQPLAIEADHPSRFEVQTGGPQAPWSPPHA